MSFIKLSVATINLFLAASLVLVACATLPPAEYPSTHPANPAAPAAVAMPTSTALRSYKSFSGAGPRESDAGSDAGQRPAPQAEQPSEEASREHHH
jgi:hypothetical protein